MRLLPPHRREPPQKTTTDYAGQLYEPTSTDQHGGPDHGPRATAPVTRSVRKYAQDRLRVATDFLTWLRKTETQPWPR